MGLRDIVTLLIICVIFYQSSCMPRRCKNNYAYKSRSPKYGKQINRPPPKIVYNNGVQKTPVPKLRVEVPIVPETSCDVPKMCQKPLPNTVNKNCPKSPQTEWNWEVPEVPDFENNFDLSLTSRPKCKECKCGSCTSTAFDPFSEPFYFKERGSFPEVDYPLDVNDFRIPSYWNDFIEEKIKQQGEEIDQACTMQYQGKSNINKANNKAIEKAVNALLMSQTNKPTSIQRKQSYSTKDIMPPCERKQAPVQNSAVTSTIPVGKESEFPTDSSVPYTIIDSSPGTVQISKKSIDENIAVQVKPDPVPNIVQTVISKPVENVVTQVLPDPIQTAISRPIENVITQALPDPISNIAQSVVSKPIENVVTQALPDPIPNIVQAVISKSKENVVAQAIPDSKQKTIQTDISKCIQNDEREMHNDNNKSTKKCEQPKLVAPLLQDIIGEPIDVLTQALQQENTVISTGKNALSSPISEKVSDPLLEPVDLMIKDIILKPIHDIPQTPLANTPINDNVAGSPTSGVISNPTEENKVQKLFHKTFPTPLNNVTSLVEYIEFNPTDNDSTFLNECSKNNCSPNSESSSKSEYSNNPGQNKPSPDEVSEINTDGFGPSLDNLITDSDIPRKDESGVKKVLIDSLLAISNMNTSENEKLETLNSPSQYSIAVGEDDFGFATLSPIDEETPTRVIRSCLKDPSLCLCPEDSDYLLLVSI